jgi:activator of HSP90 ATPase
MAVLGLLVVPARGHARGEKTATPEQGAAPAVIHQEVDLGASPAQVYEALLDSKRFSGFTGGQTAVIDPKAGGAFSCFGGHIVGRNVELLPHRRIVQAWRAAGWPDGVYSIARFELKSQGTGTHIAFDHTGFPPDQRDHLAAGWEEHYWSGLRSLKTP